MKNKLFRVQKGEWFLSSFYFIVFFILLIYFFIFSRMFYFGLSFLLTETSITSLLNVLWFNFKLVGSSLLISFPFSAIATVFLTLSEGHKFGHVSESFLRFFTKMPMLIAGLSIIFWFRESSSYMLLNVILITIIVPRLTLRWYGVARTLEKNEMESALSIGMGFWDVLYYIYLKKYAVAIIQHLIVVSISVVGLILPYLYFVSERVVINKLMGFAIFKNLLKIEAPDSLAPVLVVVLLTLSLFSIFIDKNDEQYGEWNG